MNIIMSIACKHRKKRNSITNDCWHVAFGLASFNSVCYDYRSICFQTNHQTMSLLLPWITNETTRNHTKPYRKHHASVRCNGRTVKISWAHKCERLYSVQCTYAVVLPPFSTCCPLSVYTFAMARKTNRSSSFLI